MTQTCQYIPGRPGRTSCERPATHTTTWHREDPAFKDIVLCGPHASAEDRLCREAGEPKTTERL